MKRIFLILILTASILPSIAQKKTSENVKIKVLNFATFHLSNSTDANTSPVDINNPEVKKQINKVVQELAKFQPTIICVEIPAQETAGTNEIYQEYKLDQSSTTNWAEEINSIAFEVGRLTNVANIYGIDSRVGFDYPQLMKLAEESKSPSTEDFLNKYKKDIEAFNNLSVLGKFQLMNNKKWKSEHFNFYNYLATMHTQNNFEGADIVSEFYKRNLRMYSNLSDIPKDKNDRILIIVGGTHTAYLDVFLENEPIYELIDATKYTTY